LIRLLKKLKTSEKLLKLAFNRKTNSSHLKLPPKKKLICLFKEKKSLHNKLRALQFSSWNVNQILKLLKPRLRKKLPLRKLLRPKRKLSKQAKNLLMLKNH
jgi:hypothetical protein